MSVLNKKVLALNSKWSPVDIVSVQDAFRLVSKGNAEILETINNTYMRHSLQSWLDLHMTEVYDNIRTSMMEIPIPEVIILIKYDHVPTQNLNFTKENLLLRDHGRCVYCHCRLTMSTMTVDHVIPVSKGGETSWENCVCSCEVCNREKANHLPSGRFALKSKPTLPPKITNTYRLRRKFALDTNIPASWNTFLGHNHDG